MQKCLLLLLIAIVISQYMGRDRENSHYISFLLHILL